MKLFYKIQPSEYAKVMEAIKERFRMNEEVDEQKTILMLDSEEAIELVSGSFDPNENKMAHIRVVLVDESLKEVFDSILGEPYRVK